MASKKAKSSLTALANSLDTRKREPPVVPLPRGESRGPLLSPALLRPKVEQKLAALPQKSAVKVEPPKVAPPPAKVVAPPAKPAAPAKVAAPAAKVAAPAAKVAPPAAAKPPATLSRDGALASIASLQRSPSPAPAKMPFASKPAVPAVNGATKSTSSTVASDPRRAYPRAPIHVRAHLSIADDPSRFFEATLSTLNLSVGGMFLESSFFLKIGTKLHVTLQLPQKGREVKVKAEVVRVESNVHGASGFALRFTEYLDGSQVTLATHFLSPVLREFLSQYAKEHRFAASAEYLAHTADVLAAWELKKAELGGDVWDLFSGKS
jgi:hypothetical protein